MLGKTILNLIPNSVEIYCEPFAGAANIFFARHPASAEVLNDIDGDIVNFFRVIQNSEQFLELYHRLYWEPYARTEFVRAIEILNDSNASSIDRAWAFLLDKIKVFLENLRRMPVSGIGVGLFALLVEWQKLLKALF